MNGEILQTNAHDCLEWPQERLEARIQELIQNMGSVAYRGARARQVQLEFDQLAFEHQQRQLESEQQAA